MAVRERLSRSLPILLLLIGGVVVYTILALLQWTDLDEGGYLLAAVQIAHGQVPFVNFVGIEPVVPYYLALGVRLFGASLLVARLQLIGLVLATALGLYAIGRSQHSEGAGLIAASVFLFSPLSLYYNSIVIIEAASLAPLVLAAAILFGRRGSLTAPWALGIGVLLAVAVLTRRDTALLVPLFLAVAIYRSPDGRRWASTIAAIAGFVGLLGGILGYFAARTSLPWVYAQYGFGATYSRNHVLPPYHFGALAYGILLLPAIALGMIGAAAWYFRGSGPPRAARWATRLAGIATILVLLYGLSYQSWGQGESFFLGLPVLFGAILVGWAIVRTDVVPDDPASGTREGVAFPFFIAWTALPLVFFTFLYPAFFIHYLIEITAPASLVVGIYLADRIAQLTSAAQGPVERSSRTRWSRPTSHSGSTRATARVVLLAIALTAPSALGGILILGPVNPYNSPYAHGLPAMNLYQRVYPLPEVEKVAGYLDSHTSPAATIFTADSLFAASADRLVLLNLSTIIDDYTYPSVPLRMNQSPLSYDPFGLAPTFSEIFSTWNRTYVPLVVVGNKTLSLESEVPYLRSYVTAHYHLVAVFDPGIPSQVVEIEGFGPGPVGSVLLRTVPTSGPTSAVAVDPVNGVAYLSDSPNDSLEVLNASGSNYRVALPAGHAEVLAMGLSPSATALIVSAGGDTLVDYSVGLAGDLTLSATLVVSAPVTAFAFGEEAPSVYALIPSSGKVLEIDLGTFTTLRTYTVIPTGTSLALDPLRGELLVGSGRFPSATAYNLSTGDLAQIYHYGVIANHVAVTGPLVVATQSFPPKTVWLNATSGSILAVDAHGGSTDGFFLAHGLLFVGGVADGLVTIYNSTNGNFDGFVATGTCAGSLGYDANSGNLLVAGPCSTPAELWTLRASVAYPVIAPAGTAVRVDGLKLLEPAQLELLPGAYAVEAIKDGGSSVVLASVSGIGSLDVSAPNPEGALRMAQVEFVGAAGGGAIGSVVLLALFATLRPGRFAPSDRRRA
ncbi:MAG: glycosyltransferase family 39 protein [Thermoplasmata archaeon]